MNTIRKNTLVSISLRVESEHGDLLDESEKLMYLHGGHSQIFQKLEAYLEAKQVGDTFNITLKPEDAFGEYDVSLVVEEALEDLPDEIELGMDLEGEEEGSVWFVEKIEDGYATLNANHEFAGITLVVSGEVLELENLCDEAAQEILNMDHEH